MRELELNLNSLERTIATQDLAANQARVFQRVNTTRIPGRILRDQGAARTEMAGFSHNVLTSFAASTQACNVIQVVGDNNGAIWITPGTGCGGPKNQWSDINDQWNGQPVDGYDEPLFSISKSATLQITGGLGEVRQTLATSWIPFSSHTNPGSLLKNPYVWVGRVLTSISDLSYTYSNRGMYASGPQDQVNPGTAPVQTLSGVGGTGWWQISAWFFIRDDGGLTFTHSSPLSVQTMLTDVYTIDSTNGTVFRAKGSTYSISGGLFGIYKAV